MPSTAAPDKVAAVLFSMARRHAIIAILLGLFLINLGVFWRTLDAGFLHWDDDINVFANPRVQGLTAANVKWMFTDFEQAIRYKPLSWLGWAVVHEVFELNPFGYHLANVLLHAVNTWLVFFLLLALARLASPRVTIAPPPGNVALLAAGLCALLWTVHPLRVEPVAWVTGLPYHLSLLFTLVSLLLYLQTDFAKPVFRQGVYRGAVGAYLLAVLTYPTVLGFAAALVAVNVYPLRRFNRPDGWSVRDPAARRVWLELLPFVLIAGLVVGGTVYGRLFHVGSWVEAADAEQFTLAQRVMQAFYVWAYYVWKPLWPAALCPVYPVLLDFRPTDAVFVASAAGVIAVSGALLWKVRQWPAAFAWWVAHLGLLVPMLGLTEHPHYPHDRYSILNGILWAVAAYLVFATRIPPRGRQPFLGALAAVVAALAVLSARQSLSWHGDLTFFADMAGKLPDGQLRAATLMKLGNAHSDAGDDAAAIGRYEEARRVFSDLPFFQLPFNHGNALARLGRFREAVSQYERALQLKPDEPKVLKHLGLALLQAGEVAAAIERFQAALTVLPDEVETLFHLGSAQVKANRLEEALRSFKRAAQLAPGVPEIHRQLAAVCRQQGDVTRADEHAARADELEGQRR